MMRSIDAQTQKRRKMSVDAAYATSRTTLNRAIKHRAKQRASMMQRDKVARQCSKRCRDDAFVEATHPKQNDAAINET